MPESAGKVIPLEEERRHYLETVLRLSAGDRVEIFDGSGHAWLCEVAVADEFELRALEALERDVESPLQITLLQAVPKGDRWEWVLEKATELGVARIVPIQTARSVVQIPAAKVDRKLERWRKIVESAARQSTRTVVPKIEAPTSFSQSLSSREEELLLFAHPPSSEDAVDAPPTSVAIWIGPEGGFTDDEIRSLREHGASAFGLGPRVLRSETAGMFATGLLQARWGDL